jgi:hypothetical protein
MVGERIEPDIAALAVVAAQPDDGEAVKNSTVPVVEQRHPATLEQGSASDGGRRG